ncbi:hypothetical protein IPM65_03925 [Candidatus Roizmanbacteria bacterium]|nr:MAG: hypothetical protein IPM65_03925 [Candidatus Roizmanbacteria bacterium]
MDENQSYGPVDSAQMISEPAHPQHNYRMIFITITVLLIAFGGYIVLTNDGLKARMKEALHLVSPKTEPTTNKETLELFASEITDRSQPWVEVKAPEQEATVGQEVELTVNAFSGGKDITGYDLLIGIDPSQYEVVSITSELPSFQIQAFDRGMYRAVTGIKNLQSQDPTLFNDTPLVKVVLEPKTTGEGVVTVLTTKGQERTQLVDKDVVIIEPQVGSVFITTR